jgi:hypothetical protein
MAVGHNGVNSVQNGAAEWKTEDDELLAVTAGEPGEDETEDGY